MADARVIPIKAKGSQERSEEEGRCETPGRQTSARFGQVEVVTRDPDGNRRSARRRSRAAADHAPLPVPNLRQSPGIVKVAEFRFHAPPGHG